VINTVFNNFASNQPKQMKERIIERPFCAAHDELEGPPGEMARGLDTPIIDIALTGKEIDRSYLAELTEKAEMVLEKKIRTVVYNGVDEENLP
jgi:hypothetical protein